MNAVFYHAPGCALSQAVRIGLAEKGLGPEVFALDMAAFENLEPAFLAMSPTGQAPVLDTGDGTLSEAFFILCYLDERYPDPPLGGADPAERYRVQEIGKLVEGVIAPNLAVIEWAHYGGTVTPADALGRLPAARQDLWRRAAEGFSDGERDEAETALVRALDGCEAWFADHLWLAGDHYTIADVLLAPLALRMTWVLGPATQRWLAGAASRASVGAAIGEPQFYTMGPERVRWG